MKMKTQDNLSETDVARQVLVRDNAGSDEDTARSIAREA